MRSGSYLTEGFDSEALSRLKGGASLGDTASALRGTDVCFT